MSEKSLEAIFLRPPISDLYSGDFPRLLIAATLTELHRRGAFKGTPVEAECTVAPVVYALLQALHDHHCRVYFAPLHCCLCQEHIEIQAEDARRRLDGYWRDRVSSDLQRQAVEGKVFARKMQEAKG